MEGWEDILRRMKKQETQKSAPSFRRLGDGGDYKGKEVALPGIERSKSHIRAMKSFKLLSPVHKRTAANLPLNTSILSPLVLRSITPPPAPSGRKHGSPEYCAHNCEVTTQCQDLDFPFSPRASVYDTGNLFVMRAREGRKRVEAVGT